LIHFYKRLALIYNSGNFFNKLINLNH